MHLSLSVESQLIRLSNTLRLPSLINLLVINLNTLITHVILLTNLNNKFLAIRSLKTSRLLKLLAKF